MGKLLLELLELVKNGELVTVAVHSDVDRESMHVRMADESVCIGSHQPANSYLNIPNLMSAIELTNAEAMYILVMGFYLKMQVLQKFLKIIK